MNCQSFSNLETQVPEPPFESYNSERIYYFSNLICSLVSGPQALKKMCQHFAIFNCDKKIQDIFKTGLKQRGVIVQKLLH